jgi:hypothetical protein
MEIQTFCFETSISETEKQMGETWSKTFGIDSEDEPERSYGNSKPGLPTI